MSLLLIYSLCVPLTFLIQITEPTIQTSKTNEYIPQDNDTINTVQNSTRANLSNNSKDNLTREHPNITTFDGGTSALETQTNSPLVLTRTDTNQSSTTNNVSTKDWRTSSVSQTTVFSTDYLTEASNGLQRDSAGTPGTQKSLNSARTSQHADSTSNATLQPYQDTAKMAEETALTSESQVRSVTLIPLEADETYDNVSDTNPDLITLSEVSTHGSAPNTSNDTNNSTFSSLMHATASVGLGEDVKASNVTTSGNNDMSPSTRGNNETTKIPVEFPSFALENVSSLFPLQSVNSSHLSTPTRTDHPTTETQTVTGSGTLLYNNDSLVNVTEKTPETTEEKISSVTGTNVSRHRNLPSSTLSALLSSSSSYPFISTSPTITQFSPLTDAASSLPPKIIFDNFTNLNSENISLCLQETQTLQFNTVAGQIAFSQDSYNKTDRESCIINFMGLPDMHLRMFVSINTNSCYAYSLYLRSYTPKSFYSSFGCQSQAAQVQNYGNSVTFKLVRFKLNASVEMFFNFTSVPPPQLQVLFTSSTTGFVQSPDWDGSTKYPRHLDIWTRLDIPSNFSVMISFLSMDIEGERNCNYDRLTLHVGDKKITNESIEVIHCNDKAVLKPTVFHTNVLLFHFKTDGSVEHLGFRLHFSFHHWSEIPEKLDDGKWNCSAPFWPRFQLHFNCNVVEECSDGKDEEHCDHSNSICGKGFLSIGSKCYIFISEEKSVTWNEAANECLRRHAYLASLNSPREWKEVLAIVRSLIKETVYFGLQTSGPAFPELYHNRFQWTDGSAVFYARVVRNYFSSSDDCSALRPGTWYRGETLRMIKCHENMTSSYLCEAYETQDNDPEEKPLQIVLNALEWQNKSDKYLKCPSGHITHRFLACDPQSSCWASQSDLSNVVCDYQEKPLPPLLNCRNGGDSVPYTLVCDHRSDCNDNSDEDFCIFSSCRLSEKFQCNNKQCVEHKQHCDKVPHCLDGSDERQCPWFYQSGMFTPEPPAIVDFDGLGSYKVTSLDTHTNQTNSSTTSICPETHFLCPGNLTYCMPVFVRCNGVYDCPGREDEDGCDRFECPGFYRCRSYPICVHTSHLCDGIFQCPHRDDELLCEATCPQNCTCQGLAFYCKGQFPVGQYKELRFLDAAKSGLSPENVKFNSMLIYLNLAKCKLKYFDHVRLPNLQILDISDNELSSLTPNQMTNMNNLQTLFLSGNPLQFLFGKQHDSSLQFPSLQKIDLSNVILTELNVTTLSIFPDLKFLNLSGCDIKSISGEGFQSLAYLKFIDMKGCPMTHFPRTVFKGLTRLKEVWADNYKLCCPATLPQDFYQANCHSPSDEISSCDALLRSDFYRIILSLFAALALIGNLGSFVYRVVIDRLASNLGFGAFVTHLCVSDFLMGLYLAIIGIADRAYQGNYLWKDDEWKHSAGCKVAGFLSLLSSEVSAFIICLITFDRFLVLKFPFSNLHFRKKSAHVACMIVWAIGVVFAGIPLLPATAHWQFYSQNGICIPLPITRNDFAGHDYSFGVMIIVNFVLFLLIAAGQVFIFWSIRTNSMAAGDSNKKSNDLTIARRLITIAMSDFLCWFPIGLLGLLASIGVPIPGEVNVAIAIIILPVNSAINPFLYTLNMLMEKRRKAHEKRIQKMIMSTFAGKYSETAVDRLDDSYTKPEALELIRSWLSQNLLSPENLEKVVLEIQEEQTSVETQNK